MCQTWKQSSILFNPTYVYCKSHSFSMRIWNFFTTNHIVNYIFELLETVPTH